MTNNYIYKNIRLNNLITDIDSSVATSFNNITTGINTNVTDLKTMENSAPLNYIDSTDISNRTRSFYHIFDSVKTDVRVELTIPDTSTRFTHFTLYVAGGSGGGGGSGGDAETNGGSNVDSNTSFGGVGGNAGYVALTSNIPLGTNDLFVTVGGAGTGGTRGGDDNQPGRNGSPGNPGNSGGISYVNLGSLRLCTANGGNGGGGGGGANSGGGNGNTGTAGNTGNGSIAPGYTGNTMYNSANNPTINLEGGFGGDNNGNNPSVPQGVGGQGRVGYVRIYLKYNP
jgi:hypothetical protein